MPMLDQPAHGQETSTTTGTGVRSHGCVCVHTTPVGGGCITPRRPGSPLVGQCETCPVGWS
jgi:hypothetical protein